MTTCINRAHRLFFIILCNCKIRTHSTMKTKIGEFLDFSNVKGKNKENCYLDLDLLIKELLAFGKTEPNKSPCKEGTNGEPSMQSNNNASSPSSSIENVPLNFIPNEEQCVVYDAASRPKRMVSLQNFNCSIACFRTNNFSS